MMSNSGSRARRRQTLRRPGACSLVLAVAALATGAGPAGAHGGNAALVHSCIGGGGNVKIVAADEACKKNEIALDWARDAATGTTYTAGAGLSLTANEFSVTGAPWSGLTGVPAGFADGTDDIGPDLTWGNLTGIPSDLLDGDDDGSTAVNALKAALAQDDGTPDQAGDLVSFSQIKDLSGGLGGRITGDFIRNLSIQNSDLAENSVTGANIADDAVGQSEIADDAVNGDRIADGSIRTAHLAPGVLDRSRTTTTVDPGPIVAGARVGVAVTAFGTTFGIDDIVVVSPPPSLESGLVYAGSDVLADGTLVVYLHNITATAIDGSMQTWTIRQLKTGG